MLALVTLSLTFFLSSTPSLIAGWDPRTENFLARCFVKDPAARASASDLLRHPFITAVPRKLAVGQSPDEDDEGAGAAEVLSKHVNNCLELIRERANRNIITETERYDFKNRVPRGNLLEVGINFDDYDSFEMGQLLGKLPQGGALGDQKRDEDVAGGGAMSNKDEDGEQFSDAMRAQFAPDSVVGGASPVNNANNMVSNTVGSAPMALPSGVVGSRAPPAVPTQQQQQQPQQQQQQQHHHHHTTRVSQEQLERNIVGNIVGDQRRSNDILNNGLPRTGTGLAAMQRTMPPNNAIPQKLQVR